MQAPTAPSLAPPRLPVTLLFAALTATNGLAAPIATARADEEGAIQNSAPLPAQRSAEEALAAGDANWARATDAADRNRSGPRNAAFDAWREALTTSSAGDGVRLAPAADAFRFPDPDDTHSRRAEGVAEAVKRRLFSLSTEDRSAWRDRFDSLARAAWERALASRDSRLGDLSETSASLQRVERDFPFTPSAARAALALFDLSLEAGRPSAAGAWLARASQHAPDGEREWRRALESRRSALDLALARRTGQDHTRATQAVSPTLSDQESAAPGNFAPRDTDDQASSGLPDDPLLHEVTIQRITGLTRRSDEPFGLGLTSGIAFFEDGTAVIQGAHGLLSLSPTEDGKGLVLGLLGPTRTLYEELFGIHQPVARAAPSAGGWPSLPATDGQRVALVMGRGEPGRSFRDIETPAVGNALGMCLQGPKSRPLQPLWVVRDGIVAYDPSGDRRSRRDDDRMRFGTLTDTFSRDGGRLNSWDLGTGWEFQPGPVMADGTLFVLARGLGSSGGENAEDHTDEVRLLAMDARTAAVRWSVSVTKERGLLDGTARGEGGYYASTTMPLMIERTTGTLLVGTNSGLLAAYSVADGRLLWAFRNQRRRVSEGGWPGSRPPLVVEAPEDSGAPGRVAWFTPFDSGFCYALPAGPAPLDGSLLREAPRRRDDALDLAAVLPLPPTRQNPLGAHPSLEERSTLVLLGRHGRHSALLVDHPGGLRQPAAYLAPDDRFAGTAALDASGTRLWLAGTTEVSGFAAARDFSLFSAAPLASQGAGTGGNTVRRGELLYILGRDTVWVFRLPGR
ncbi:hypothetical protein Poly30_41300 [Planctomycetes bacterium Poly30]|uniref:Outer membrane biogenesis protein BamB n=1 Tax=Saltatorellus ferox TaxID=2528018 RepID=A0A518EWY2_9BACT|nr:hypothetical protein Poly30_41300 [Planctomycetes bacterium Poly30]